MAVKLRRSARYRPRPKRASPSCVSCKIRGSTTCLIRSTRPRATRLSVTTTARTTATTTSSPTATTTPSTTRRTISNWDPFRTGGGTTRTIPSRFRVSREWRDIAIGFLLRQVTAHQCAKPIFLFAIAPRHGHLVEELDIAYWHDSCSTMNLVSSLTHMPLVRKIAFPALDLVCARLADQARASDLPVEFASRAAEEASLFCWSVTLTTLELEATSEDQAFVPRLISGCISLRTLKITTAADEENTFRNAASVSYRGHPNLRRLEIRDRSGGQGLYDFVQNLTIALEELEICWGESTPGEVEPSDPCRGRGFRLPRLRKLEVRGDFKMSAPLIRHISPSSFPALQDCTWRLYRNKTPDYRMAFVAEPVVAAISHLREQHFDHAVPLKVDIFLDLLFYGKALRPALEASGIQINVEQGGVVIGVKQERWTGCGFRSFEPADFILNPKRYRLEENCGDEIEQLGHTVSASLDRIRDLKDQAVAVGDRVQVSRIAQALQEGEWLCVERQC